MGGINHQNWWFIIAIPTLMPEAVGIKPGLFLWTDFEIALIVAPKIAADPNYWENAYPVKYLFMQVNSESLTLSYYVNMYIYIYIL